MEPSINGTESGETPLDFPAERVWGLLEELYRILFDYFAASSAVALESFREHQRVLSSRFWEAYSKSEETARNTVRFLRSRILDSWEEWSSLTAGKNLEPLLDILRDILGSFREYPLWIQAVAVCVWVFVARRCLAFLRELHRRRHQRRRRRQKQLPMKTGRSNIQQGRTTLVYGAAGDLMDEEYLEEDEAASDGNSQSWGRRGRFGTFDFFGINSTPSGKSADGRRTRNRLRTQSDDYLFGIGNQTPRQRTSSMDSLGNPSGAALVRPRTDSMGSLSDTLGGYFQSFRDYRENQRSSAAAGPHRIPGQTPTVSHQKKQTHSDDTTATPSSESANKNPSKNMDASEKTSVRFRRERIGSMDIYYAPGKNQPHVSQNHELGGASAMDDSLKAATTYSFGEDGFGFDGNGENNRFGRLGDTNEMQYLYDEFGVVTLSHKVEYYGPFRPLLNCGFTLVPPLPYEEASRRIDRTEIDLPLKRIIKIDLLKGVLRVIEPTTTVSQNQKWDLVYDDIDEISTKFRAPLEGAVMFLYKKGTPQHSIDWKEHSFESSRAAAQFQLDLVAYQVLGKSIRRIFEALHLVHQGSLAYDGQEFVMHDKVRKKSEKESEKKFKKSAEAFHCVAWDDAMRAMSSIPTVRIALERLWLSHNRPSSVEKKAAKTAKDKSKIALEKEKVSDAELSLLKEEYIKNRLLLGPVDFYRLFVPTLPETAIPEGDFNNRARMEQLLCWRKRVARASVLVRSYIRARVVVNRGWNLQQSLPPPGTSVADAGSALTGTLDDHGGENITKRFAYDGNENNTIRDVSAKNEIYEASVSRDVLCHVRPFDYLNQKENDDKPQKSSAEENDAESLETGDHDSDQHSTSSDNHHAQKHLVLSPYQAYTYVESHYFKATDEMLDEDGPMHPSRDPVDMFPSLKAILVRHPDLHFFVDCLSNPQEKILIVNLHVRSLAKGIDPQFDNVIDRFSKASEENRKRKLYLMVQMGNTLGLSFLNWFFIQLLSLYFRFNEICRDSPINLESTRDRYGFPGFRVGGLFKTYHFGGSLQVDSNKPSNYVGLTKCVAASYHESLIGKFVFDKLHQYFSKSTVDLTFVIEGERNDELPERALSSLRIVHVNPNKVAKDPRPYLAMIEDRDLKKRRIIGRGKFSSMILQDAVQYSLDSVRSLVNSNSQVIFPEVNEEATMNGGGLGVITEVDEDFIDGTIPRHLQREGETLDPLERGIDVVVDTLRSAMVLSRHKPETLYSKSPKQSEEYTEENRTVIMRRILALRMFDRNDIGRYIVRYHYDLRIVSERLIETAAWRGQTFPIDKRSCRIELQSGQFFQQGFDKKNNPVFYFRNLCRGPWREDTNATILAILYRLDKSLKYFSRTKSNTRITLVVLMGHAKRGARKRKNSGIPKESSSNDNKDSDGDFDVDDESSAESRTPEDLFELPSEEEIKVNAGNPRISPDEKWTCHTNVELLQRLFEILVTRYPGRLSKILVVKGRGRNHYYREQIQGRMLLRKILSGIDKENFQNLTKKLKFVRKTSELTQYIKLTNLVTVVGGIAPIDPSAYNVCDDYS